MDTTAGSPLVNMAIFLAFVAVTMIIVIRASIGISLGVSGTTDAPSMMRDTALSIASRY